MTTVEVTRNGPGDSRHYEVVVSTINHGDMTVLIPTMWVYDAMVFFCGSGVIEWIYN